MSGAIFGRFGRAPTMQRILKLSVIVKFLATAV